MTPTFKMFMGKPVEPAERDPGFGWLRTRVRAVNPAGLFVWPRAGHEAACGRPACPVCERASTEAKGELLGPG